MSYYREIQQELKIYRDQCLAVPPLNGKKAILEEQLYNIYAYFTYLAWRNDPNSGARLGLTYPSEEQIIHKAFNLTV